MKLKMGTTTKEETPLATQQKQTGRRVHQDGNAWFTLENESQFAIRVTHREQTGWVGMTINWDPMEPFAWTRFERDVRPDGLNTTWGEGTPDQAFRTLCYSMVRDQRVKDAKKGNQEEKKRAARTLLREFMQEFPMDLSEELNPAGVGPE